MKSSSLLAALAALLLVAVAPPATASDKASEGREVAQQLLEHAEPGVRAAALLTLGHAGTAEERAALERFKAADGPEERLAAGLAMILARQRDGLSFAAEQLRTSRRPFEVLGEVAVMLPEEQVRALVEAALNGAEAPFRRDAFRFLAGQGGALYDLLAAQLRSSDEEVRSAALQAVLHSARGQSLEVASTLMRQRDSAVRAQALQITARLKDRPDLRGDLVTLLTNAVDDRDDAIKVAAARQLVELKEQKGTDYLISTLAGAEKAERIALINFLLENNVRANLADVRPLIAAVEADEADRQQERELLYELAATSRDSAFFSEVSTKFASNIFEDRLVGSVALGRFGTEEARELLSGSVRDGQVSVRRNVVRGLGQIGSSQGLTALGQALNDPDREVRLLAIEAIGQVRDPQSVNVLRRLFNDQDAEIQLAVVEALNSVGLPESARGLEMLLRSRNLEVQWRAFVSLLRINPEVAERHVRTALRNPPETFGSDLNPFVLNASARDAVYRQLLTHSGSRVRNVAAQHVSAHREALLPLARELVLSADLHPDIRRDLVLVIVAEGADEDLARLDRVMRDHPRDAAGRIAAWRLANVAGSNFEASFRGFLSREDSVMKAIAAYALTKMD